MLADPAAGDAARLCGLADDNFLFESQQRSRLAQGEHFGQCLAQRGSSDDEPVIREVLADGILHQLALALARSRYRPLQMMCLLRSEPDVERCSGLGHINTIA